MEWLIKRFEELTLQELYDILRLRNSVFILEQKCPYQDIDGRDSHGYHLFLKDEDGKICAYLRILEKGQTFDEISIGRVIVRKDKRGAGLAKAMLLKAISFIRKRLNGKTIKIEAQAYLKEFYRKIGFEPYSDLYLEDDIPHIKMVRKETTITQKEGRF
jgi:ElaA protein